MRSYLWHALALALVYGPFRYFADTWNPHGGVPNPGVRRNPHGGLPAWPYPLGPTVLYGPEGFAGASLPAGWSWSEGAGDEDGEVTGGTLVLAPIYADTPLSQVAKLDYIDPAPATPTALSLRWSWCFVAHDPDTDASAIILSWDAIGSIVLATVGESLSFSWGFIPLEVTGIAVPALGAITVNEIVADAPGGIYRARYFRDGVLLATLTDTSEATPDFSSAGFQAGFSASATAPGGAPEVRVDDVTVADDAQGV